MTSPFLCHGFDGGNNNKKRFFKINFRVLKKIKSIIYVKSDEFKKENKDIEKNKLNAEERKKLIKTNKK